MKTKLKRKLELASFSFGANSWRVARQCNVVIPSLSAKLLCPGDSEGTFWSSSQHTRGGFTLSLLKLNVKQVLKVVNTGFYSRWLDLT